MKSGLCWPLFVSNESVVCQQNDTRILHVKKHSQAPAGPSSWEPFTTTLAQVPGSFLIWPPPSLRELNVQRICFPKCLELSRRPFNRAVPLASLQNDVFQVCASNLACWYLYRPFNKRFITDHFSLPRFPQGSLRLSYRFTPWLQHVSPFWFWDMALSL